MEMVLSNGFCEMTMDEIQDFNGGISTETVASIFVTVAGVAVGAAVGYVVGGPVGAVIGGKNGAAIGSLVGSVVGGVASIGTEYIINSMAEN